MAFPGADGNAQNLGAIDMRAISAITLGAILSVAVLFSAIAEVVYTYDELARITSATYDVGGTITLVVYHYDPAGNRTTRVVVDAASNLPPTAIDDSAQAIENSPVTLDPRVNDTDVDGIDQAITAKSDGSYGTVVINSETSVTYTPVSSFAGTDSFTYTIADEFGATDSATVNVNVSALPPAPGPSYAQSVIALPVTSTFILVPLAN